MTKLPASKCNILPENDGYLPVFAKQDTIANAALRDSIINKRLTFDDAHHLS